jgi:membrane protein YqaA with SNARE-associated domain
MAMEMEKERKQKFKHIIGTYIASFFGTLIQFGVMLLVYSWLTMTPFNLIVFITVAGVFGLIFAPMQLILNNNK